MDVVVDGSNVMGSRADGWWRDRRGAAARLAAELGQVQALQGATVVFDGRGEARAEGGVSVVFSAPQSADDWIVERLAAARADGQAPGTVRVYTSDRGLRERVEAQGQQVAGAGQVLAMVRGTAGEAGAGDARPRRGTGRRRSARRAGRGGARRSAA